jgi:hypothetical protein
MDICRRRPRRARPSRDTIKDRASIRDRPKDIEARADIGHWEGDLIICKRTRPMPVLHERKSRMTVAARLTRKTAAETIRSCSPCSAGSIPPCEQRRLFISCADEGKDAIQEFGDRLAHGPGPYFNSHATL